MNRIEHQLVHAGAQPERFAGGEADPARLAENLRVIEVELDAPRDSRLARVLRRLGVPDLTVPLVTATPSLRRSWFIAVAIALLFSLSVASNDTASGVDRIVVFLTLAPLVPLAGVALAFGAGVDPTHELVVAAPRDTFVVFMIRALTVLAASSLMLLVGSVLLPGGGAYRVAWLLPALAISAVTLAGSARYEPRRIASVVAAAWVLLVVVVATASSSASMFGAPTQVVSLVVAVSAAWFVGRRRERFEQAGIEA